MNVIIDIGHPAHVHLFRNSYLQLKKRGHHVIVTTRNIQIILRLLDSYEIPYINLGKKRNSKIGKAFATLHQDIQLLLIVIKHQIQVGISSGIALSHVSKVTKMKSIIFDDDDDSAEPLMVKFGHFFADVIVTPNVINRKTKANISYNGTHELSYLHPHWFKPNIAVLKDVGLTEKDKYFVVRFVAFQGHHDYGHFGISLEQKIVLVDLLSSKGKVFITSEKPIEPELEKYRLPVPPDKIHTLLYYATMFIGDSQTMTSEAAILGTPALKCNTFAGLLAVPNELEQEFDLCYSFNPKHFDIMMLKIKGLLETTDLKKEWELRRKNFIKKKIDVTKFFLWLIENYPASKKIALENPDYTDKFK